MSASSSSSSTNPINILLCGGFAVGKTMLLSRLCGFQYQPFSAEYSPSQGATLAVLELPLCDGRLLKLQLWDLSAEMLTSGEAEAAVVQLVKACEGALVITDPLRRDCAAWTDLAAETLHRHAAPHTPCFLLVNKADQRSPEHAISASQLDRFVASADLLQSWFYTVGHPLLGDLDHTRGAALRQKPVEEVLRKLLVLIARRRHEHIHAALCVPIVFRPVQWRRIAAADLADFISDMTTVPVSF